jgi:L-ornithine N5-oxygenase
MTMDLGAGEGAGSTRSFADRSGETMTIDSTRGGDAVYDILGVGCGPANLALAVALAEHAEDRESVALNGLFLEARPEPCWHPGMLLDGSLIQISVLKDLATVRNPRSRFTFLNYLKEKGRLFEFLNLRNLFPSRYEFNDYLRWVSAELGPAVRSGFAVRAVRPAEPGPSGRIESFEVDAQDAASGSLATFRANNVVLATGGRPTFPEGLDVRPDGRILHPASFAQRIGELCPDRQCAYRFAVVGSGQSGAELFFHLLDNYPNAQVTASVRKFGYKPVDESDFTNEIFFPHMVDWVYGLPRERRREVVDSFRDVNYAVVDHPLIQKIYRALYDEKVRGKTRARLEPFQQLVAIEETDDAVRLEFDHLVDGDRRQLEVDYAVLATGYTWEREKHPLLAGVEPFVVERDGRWGVGRDYRLETTDELAAGIYLQGYAEDTHGISETVLSLLPVRAQDILDSIVAGRVTAPDRQGVVAPAVVGD